MLKRKRITIILIILIIAGLLAAFIWSPFSNYAVSLGVMKVYSRIHENRSIISEKGIQLSIPGGGITDEKDWYPFVMTFNAGESFSRFAGEELELTILYNFPAFDVLKGCSRIYDPDSPYYNSFYGAYLVTAGEAGGETHAYGFNDDGTVNLDDIAQVPQFDFERLVLADFGLKSADMQFDWEAVSIAENVEYAGTDGWTRIDVQLTVNGMLHEKSGFHQTYLQYGSPGYSPEEAGIESFAPVDMLGRVYARYFEEWDTSIFFYVLTCSEDVLEDCDSRILSQSTIS